MTMIKKSNITHKLNLHGIVTIGKLHLVTSLLLQYVINANVICYHKIITYKSTSIIYYDKLYKNTLTNYKETMRWIR